MDFYLSLILFAALAYLIGSISTAIITCKIMGLEDPRKIGSHNPGATNVLRHGGKKAGIITLTGDMLKGLIPVLVVSQFQADTLSIAVVGLSAFLGHLFPVYYGFKGGKGVATYYGVLFGVNWLVGLIAVSIWLAIAVLMKISSLSALISISATPLILWYFSHSVELTSVMTVMSILVIWRHQSNIRFLLQGTEGKIGTK
jgi:acyl phosphate:glycerol-3-phosphate acyltransferase